MDALTADWTVHGGAGGIMAHLVDLDQLSVSSAELGADLARIALLGHRLLLDAGGLVSAPLDPAGWVEFEAALVSALDGPGGLVALAATMSVRAAALRTAALAYRATDEARELAFSPVAVRAATAALSLLYPDGRSVVTDRGVDPGGLGAPVGLTDLFAGLARRGDAAAAGGEGQVDVRVLTHADRTRSYIVDIPGTRSWDVNPFQDRPVINDLGTNLHAIDGRTTAYERGVAEALRRAGATPTDPVMLVGHSQGGIVAANAAKHFVSSGEFTVTHVVTAGAPIGAVELPDTVAVLSLENTLDPVPYLDVAANPDRPHRITVRFAAWTEQPHSLDGVYAPAAAELDRCDDPSVRAFLGSATAFLDPTAGSTSTHVYAVSRDSSG